MLFATIAGCGASSIFPRLTFVGHITEMIDIARDRYICISFLNKKLRFFLVFLSVFVQWFASVLVSYSGFALVHLLTIPKVHFYEDDSNLY